MKAEEKFISVEYHTNQFGVSLLRWVNIQLALHLESVHIESAHTV